MGLQEYQKKRHFEETPEPKGKKTSSHKGNLEFVVQEHHASHLHYDFRLEVEGVLKSWAIPKGPSQDPANKRLAIQVEDHPYEYRTFEGTIPEGSYGAGTVYIWDRGTYRAIGANTRQESEKLMLQGLKEGRLNFILEGKKLKGAFSLIQLRGKKNQWLLIKTKDTFSSSSPSPSRPAKKSKAKNWVKPELVCEVHFAEWTDEGLMRQAVFIELREDKAATEVVRERTFSTQEIIHDSSKPVSKKDQTSPPLTHLDKIYWPEEGYTKGDLIAYYQEVAPLILPYLQDRPQTLRRYPNGIEGTSFYQKKVKNMPEWLRTEEIQHEDHSVRYLFIEDQKSLLYVVNLGCIDLHPFISRFQSLQSPDYLVMDLDPEGVEFDQVIEVAQAIGKFLKELDIPSVCKTSGGRGLHIYVPLGALYSFDEVQELAHLLALLIHQRLPDLTSLERSPKKRQGKIYLDYLQNHFGQTVVAPYSVRPRPGALVSTPLKWSEVKKGLNPKDFTIKTVLKRFKKIGDLFQIALRKGIDLPSLLRKIQANHPSFPGG